MFDSAYVSTQDPGADVDLIVPIEDIDAPTLAMADLEVEGFFVSPSGSASSDGGAEDPWDLQTALSHPGAIKPGDTIWLRGGTYRGEFISRLVGTADNPITVRAYPGEHITIDTYAGPSRGNPVFRICGAYTWYCGFEVLSSDPHTRLSRETGPFPGDQRRGAISNEGDQNRLINLVVHDLNNGIGAWSAGEGGGIYGCVVYNNGWAGFDKPWNHGIYTHNEHGTKQIADNIIFNNFQVGLKIYRENGPIQGYVVEGNTVFGAGIDLGKGYTSGRKYTPREILIGGKKSADDITLRENYTYRAGDRGWSDLSYSFGAANGKLSFEDNYLATDVRFLRDWTPGNVEGNTVIGDLTGVYAPEDGFEVTEALGTKVFVRPNEYEEGRANVTVYNWNKLASIEVDLTSVLTVGAAYELHHVYDLFGDAVVSGVYDGSPVNVPMRAMNPPLLTGLDRAEPDSIGPEFGVFVVTTLSASPGPVGYWSFEEGSGSTTADISGDGHNGILNGATWSIAGKVGNALRFDGNNDFVDTGNWDIGSSELTIAAWINADSFVGTYRDGRIVSKAIGDQTQDHFWMLSTIAQGSETRLRFRLKTNGQTDMMIAGSGNLLTGQWYHVAAVYDGALMRLYVDGSQVDAMPKSGPISTSQHAPVWIGNNPVSRLQPFHGRIDDVRVYDEALGAAEISALMEQPSLPNPESVEGSIAAGRQYDLAVTFGNDGFRLYPDGQLAASQSDFTQGLDQNTENLAIGANIWARADRNPDGTWDPFDGRIAGFTIYDGQFEPSFVARPSVIDFEAESETLTDPTDVLDELAHVFGYGHARPLTKRVRLMSDTLFSGIRRNLDPDLLDAVFEGTSRWG